MDFSYADTQSKVISITIAILAIHHRVHTSLLCGLQTAVDCCCWEEVQCKSLWHMSGNEPIPPVLLIFEQKWHIW